jgi:ubiquitin carboxyl-terminal hydrolase 6/32
VFDVDRDGVLSRVELKDMVVALLEVWKDNRTDDIPVSSDSFCLLVGF